MRVLGCLDGTNAEQIGQALRMFSLTLSANQPLTTALLTVIDVGPRRDIDRVRERHFRPAMHHEHVTEEILESERAAAQETLNAGLRYVASAETLLKEGRPELEIVNAAAEWNADLILICARAEYGEPPHVGPRSVGHVARFVLDHAPCPVLLMRPLARDQFPINR